MYIGDTFSWEQYLLLSIARAIEANPRIMLIDEITANLVTATEKLIISAICGVSQGRSILAIFHHESATRDFDKPISLENGEITVLV